MDEVTELSGKSRVRVNSAPRFVLHPQQLSAPFRLSFMQQTQTKYEATADGNLHKYLHLMIRPSDTQDCRDLLRYVSSETVEWI